MQECSRVNDRIVSDLEPDFVGLDELDILHFGL